MELKKRCTCAGVRSDWINRHSFSVNDSLPGWLFIPQELLADEFGKGKGKLGKPVESVYNSAQSIQGTQKRSSPPSQRSEVRDQKSEIRSQRSEVRDQRPEGADGSGRFLISDF